MPMSCRHWIRRIAVAALLALLLAAPLHAEPQVLQLAGFAFEVETVVAGTPEEAFEAFTAETLAWWDHHFAAHPRKLFFEPRPGGGFMEIFDDAGNGARHAEVIYAERPQELRFVGPLGLSGNAIDMVHTLTFKPDAAGGTRVHLAVHGFGEALPGIAATVEKVWQHFLVERFQPYMAAREK
jgi:uncharacterized protein YndB with AHSA1/START domain